MPGTRNGNQVANGTAQRESDEENVSFRLNVHSMNFCLQKVMCFVQRTISSAYRVQVIRTPHHIAEV